MIQGYRRFIFNDKTVELVGAFAGTWESAEQTAVCKATVRDVTPEWRNFRAVECADHLKLGMCTCGIYITKDNYPHASTMQERFEIRAITTGWGAYVEYDGGWRVQHARIEQLMWFSNFPEDQFLADKLQVKYQVPVKFITGVRECCFRQHTTKFYKNDNGIEVPICKLSTSKLHTMWELVIRMGNNAYANKELLEIQMELDVRGESAVRI